jgi:ornithine cyclodeaminase/alanine dehydrogenase-like protein (mu-crystallin family)
MAFPAAFQYPPANPPLRTYERSGPAMTLILSNEDIDRLLTMGDYVDILEDAYRELAAGRGVVRPRADSLAPTSMPGAVYGLKSADGIAPKFGTAAVRINSDIITYPEVGGVPRRVKVPAAPNKRWVGLVLLFSTETGEPLAIFPDGAMQRMRVGATSGLAAKYLARKDARTAAIIGSGFQAGAQLMAIAAVRGIERVRCFSPSRENREAYCREWSERLKCDVTPADTGEAAVKGADVVACSTSALGTVFFEKWLEPGMHLSSIKLPEIEPAAVNRADLVVIHNHEDKAPVLETSDLPNMKKISGKDGEVKKAVGFDTLPTVFDLIAGRVKGRTSDAQVTCFLNNTGTGYQFAACGAVAYRKAKERGLGHELPTDWFTEDVHP